MEAFISCHQYLERQPMPFETRTRGFNASLTRTFCFCGGCADEVQLKAEKNALLSVSIKNIPCPHLLLFFGS